MPFKRKDSSNWYITVGGVQRTSGTAVEADAKHSFKREAAIALIDAWRTQQSTLRAEGKAYG